VCQATRLRRNHIRQALVPAANEGRAECPLCSHFMRIDLVAVDGGEIQHVPTRWHLIAARPGVVGSMIKEHNLVNAPLRSSRMPLCSSTMIVPPPRRCASAVRQCRATYFATSRVPSIDDPIARRVWSIYVLR
jgi:hypothetical protein